MLLLLATGRLEHEPCLSPSAPCSGWSVHGMEVLNAPAPCARIVSSHSVRMSVGRHVLGVGLDLAARLDRATSPELRAWSHGVKVALSAIPLTGLHCAVPAT